MRRVYSIVIIPTAITTKVMLHWIAVEFALVTAKTPYFASFKFFDQLQKTSWKHHVQLLLFTRHPAQ